MREIMSELSPELLLAAYAHGVFPMAESRDDPNLYWLDPEERGILPLESFHLSRRLKRTVRSDRFDVRIDSAFPLIIDACAAPRPTSQDSWINDEIKSLYAALFDHGFCHSVECWREGRLVGGLYGVHIGGAFFGESMFSLERDASKVALVHLVARLRAGGFSLLDTQFVTDHLTQFGVIEVSRENYQQRLRQAIRIEDADFFALPDGVIQRLSGELAIQSITQTS